MAVSGLAIGVLIELCGTTLSVCGLNGQKYAMEHNARISKADPSKSRPVYRNWRWCLGFTSFLIGQLCEMLAQGFAAQEVIIAVSNISLVTNAIVASCVFGETFNILPVHRECSWRLFKQWDLSAVLLILGSTALVVIVAPEFHPDDYDVKKLTELMGGVAFIMYLVLTGIMLLVLTIMLWCVIPAPPKKADRETKDLYDALNKKSQTGAYCYALFAATTGSYVVTFSKITLLIIRSESEGEGQGAFKNFEVKSHFMMASFTMSHVLHSRPTRTFSYWLPQHIRLSET
jgi:hypothetical protein